MQTHQFYETLHVNPCVVYAKMPWVDHFAPQFETDAPVAILCATNWKLTPVVRRQALAWAKGQLARHPNHYVEFLCDRDDEFRFFHEAGLPVTLFNPNALSDEHVFRPLPRNKLYDAVYIARPTQHKRLHLCRDIGQHTNGRWLWITYETEKNPTIVESTLKMPNVRCPQMEDGKFTGFVSRLDMPGQLCRAKCGLCLSDEEGSNYASTEYLLCGLPVVYTDGETSRDKLFPDDYAIRVDATPEDVARGVRLAKTLSNAERCREETLAMLAPHRMRFVQALRRAYKTIGIQHDPAFDLFHLWRHQLQFWQPVKDVLTGGNAENRELLSLARTEPRVRRLWADSPFWEQTKP